MDFGEDIGLWQRKLSDGPEGMARRLAVFEALGIKPVSRFSISDVVVAISYVMLHLRLEIPVVL
jgi:hypothetical protein